MSNVLRVLLATAWLAVAGCTAKQGETTSQYPNTSATRIPTRGAAKQIVEGARLQMAHPSSYSGAYYAISYPGGDVPPDRGACTDVVIRALRHAGYDLQKLIHEDMEENLSIYPRHGNRSDPNIDHRRVPNQRRFFTRFGLSLDTSKDWEPGDIVTWKLDGGLDHTGVLTDVADKRGVPLVIHNLSQTAEEDVLMSWKITGHYRFPKAPTKLSH
jgi:uncharacterized protein YijF (DUF1287 family)